MIYLKITQKKIEEQVMLLLFPLFSISDSFRDFCVCAFAAFELGFDKIVSLFIMKLYGVVVVAVVAFLPSSNSFHSLIYYYYINISFLPHVITLGIGSQCAMCSQVVCVFLLLRR